MHRTFTSLALALTLLGLQGCARPARIKAIGPDSVIVAFGDSLTSGVDVAPGETYPAILRELLGCEVANEGQPGELSAEGAARLPAILNQHKPGLVLLCHGGNDLGAAGPDGDVALNLRSMIETMRQRGIDVILIAPPRPSLRLRVPGFYRRLASEFGVPCDTATLPSILSSPALKGDPIHPNAAGNRALAEAVVRLIRASSAD